MEDKKTVETTLKKIKTHGYWQIRFLPTTAGDKRVERRQQLQEILTKSAIHLRGWDYPHVSYGNPENQNMYLKQDHYEGWIDWDRHKEIWRVYENGQFIHLSSIWEDWRSEDVFSPPNDPYRQIEPGTLLEVVGTNYLMTEIFLFLLNLYDNEFYKDNIDVDITLKNTRGRHLWVWDQMRAPLLGNYECYSDEVNVRKSLTKEDVLENYDKVAIDTVCEIFEQFQWMDPPRKTLEQDQKNLLEKRPY